MSRLDEDEAAEGPALGTVVADKYRLERELAAGGMGRVVSARHLILDKPVAIKFVVGAPGSEKARRRFLAEARAAQALASEHILRVYDVGFCGERPFIVMELLDGEDLEMMVREDGPLPISEAVDYVLQACIGVAEAHAAGIVHRDIKPANLFLTQTTAGDPLVKVLDFGISKVLGESGDAETTQANTLLGSPSYMSPEQLRNPAKVDGRSDIWSLAVTLYYLLSKTYPFSGDTATEVNAAVFTERPADLRCAHAELPAALWGAISAALEKRPDDRVATIREFSATLAPFASSRGQLMAQRLQHTGQSATPRRPAADERPQLSVAETEADGPGAETQSGLATTDGTHAASAEDEPQPRHWGWFAAAAAVLGAGVGWWWLLPGAASSRTGAAASAPVTAGTIQPPAMSSHAPSSPTAAKRASATAPTASAALPDAAAPGADRRKNQQSRRRAPRTGNKSAPTKTESPVLLDIDGIPIVE